MTDKEQIIIDGVDVSGCTLYGDRRCNNACNPLNCLFCSDKPNCHYKQLARKTQAYNELLEQYKEQITNNLVEDINVPSKKQIIINGVDVSKCPNFRESCRPDYSGGYLYRNVCRAGSFSYCEGKPCGYKCVEYAKRLGLSKGYEFNE